MNCISPQVQLGLYFLVILKREIYNRDHRDCRKLLQNCCRHNSFRSIASFEEEWQAEKQTAEVVVVVVRAVAKQTMIHRHVAEALPSPSLATLYRFCFLLCRRDLSFATKEPHSPKNLNNTPITEGLQTERQRRERDRETLHFGNLPIFPLFGRRQSQHGSFSLCTSCAQSRFMLQSVTCSTRM